MTKICVELSNYAQKQLQLQTK